MERDGWILLQSASPKAAAVWFADKLEAIDDPEFVAIYLEYDAAFDWPADDPRLEALADRSKRWFVRQGDAALTSRKQPAADPGIAQLIATSTGSSSPAWDRLKEIAKERRAAGCRSIPTIGPPMIVSRLWMWPLGPRWPHRATRTCLGWLAGFEPATARSTIWCSAMLSYSHHGSGRHARPRSEPRFYPPGLSDNGERM